ncbi:hypothetical protein F2Q68_00036737 [Brassica cretica]|uniref:Uncharacterized protein n=1 Tax=Brassica cretica TaxID=69181 RepID=A0A8S9HBA8_BRACR|nr:hypothetical protein F2Q68_00036737 [Brassica cretica]
MKFTDADGLRRLMYVRRQCSNLEWSFCRIPPRSGSRGLPPRGGAAGVCCGFLDCTPFGVVNPSSSFFGLLLMGGGTGMFTSSDFFGGAMA